MTQRISDRLYIAILLAALICTGLFGCSQSEAVVPVEKAVPTQLSKVQEAYLQRHGNPDLFAVNFEQRSAKVAASHGHLSPVRRVDTWIYFGQPVHMVVFDDGFQVEDRDMEPSFKPKLKTFLKPTDFSSHLVQTDITSRYGNPDNQEKASIHGQDLTILTYQENQQEPKKTFGFINDELVAVTIGFRFAGK